MKFRLAGSLKGCSGELLMLLSDCRRHYVPFAGLL